MILPHSAHRSVLRVQCPLSTSLAVRKLTNKCRVTKAQTPKAIDQPIFELAIVHPVLGVKFTTPFKDSPFPHSLINLPSSLNQHVKSVVNGRRI